MSSEALLTNRSGLQYYTERKRVDSLGTVLYSPHYPKIGAWHLEGRSGCFMNEV